MAFDSKGEAKGATMINLFLGGSVRGFPVVARDGEERGCPNTTIV